MGELANRRVLAPLFLILLTQTVITMSSYALPVIAPLAAELEQLNTTARTQSRALAYDVDALGFSGVLQNLKRPRRQG